MRSERKCETCYDPIHRFQRVKAKSSFFLENNNIFEGKKYTVFLVLLRSTCVQKLRQFDFLTLAIKISFLFDFCTNVLLTQKMYTVSYCRHQESPQFKETNLDHSMHHIPFLLLLPASSIRYRVRQISTRIFVSRERFRGATPFHQNMPVCINQIMACKPSSAAVCASKYRL